MPKWTPNQCFELYVESPYDDETYKTFQLKDKDGKDVQPTCFSPKKKDIKIECSLKKGTTNTVQFYFSDFPTELAADQVVWVGINNFYTPWSGQTLRNIQVRYYQDRECKLKRKEV